MSKQGETFVLAIWFEAGLGFAGMAGAWAAGLPLYGRLELSSAAVLRGCWATLPLLALLGWMTTTSWQPVVALREQVQSLVDELFATSHWLGLAWISLAAGVGEELLFRGALQPWIASWSHPLCGWAAASLLFGCAHCLSPTYCALATLMGGYLGFLALQYDDLVAPIVAHSLYDFVALVTIRARGRKI